MKLLCILSLTAAVAFCSSPSETGSSSDSSGGIQVKGAHEQVTLVRDFLKSRCEGCRNKGVYCSCNGKPSVVGRLVKGAMLIEPIESELVRLMNHLHSTLLPPQHSLVGPQDSAADRSGSLHRQLNEQLAKAMQLAMDKKEQMLHLVRLHKEIHSVHGKQAQDVWFKMEKDGRLRPLTKYVEFNKRPPVALAGEDPIVHKAVPPATRVSFDPARLREFLFSEKEKVKRLAVVNAARARAGMPPLKVHREPKLRVLRELRRSAPVQNAIAENTYRSTVEKELQTVQQLDDSHIAGEDGPTHQLEHKEPNHKEEKPKEERPKEEKHREERHIHHHNPSCKSAAAALHHRLIHNSHFKSIMAWLSHLSVAERLVLSVLVGSLATLSIYIISLLIAMAFSKRKGYERLSDEDESFVDKERGEKSAQGLPESQKPLLREDVFRL